MIFELSDLKNQVNIIFFFKSLIERVVRLRMSMRIRNPLNTHTQNKKFLRIIVWL